MEVAFHPAWLIKAWYGSPLRDLDPHLTSLIVLALVLGMIYRSYQGQQAPVEAEVQTQLAAHRQRLLAKLDLLEKERQAGSISEQEYLERLSQLQVKLVAVEDKNHALNSK